MEQEASQKKPVIGILANLFTMEAGLFPGQERAYVNHEYVTSIVKAHAVPILLPIIENSESIRKQVELVDGILLSGGYDVHPLFYGEEPHHRLEYVYPERDYYELQVVKIAEKLNKPILGICRGLQLLNVAFGGSLYQDLSQHEPASDIQHTQKAKMHVPSHTVDLVPHTKLQQIFDLPSIVTNSFHHQAVKKIAPGFIVNARAKDGIIEGIEKNHSSSFIVGVQWHPEMMTDKHPSMLKIFTAFITQANLERGQCGRI
jgi:putative glutamine amidotransferase